MKYNSNSCYSVGNNHGDIVALLGFKGDARIYLVCEKHYNGWKTVADFCPDSVYLQRLSDELIAERNKMPNAELHRVSSRINWAVLKFVDNRLTQDDRQFTEADLAAFVRSQMQTAPSSPTRILRMLREQGKINYRVVSRRKSLYEALNVAT